MSGHADHVSAFDLLESLARIKGQRVLVVGDVMVDEYVFGQVSRISPEAPVPVVHVESRAVALGGAGNVAQNIKALGGEPVLVGVVGDDESGVKLATDLTRLDIEHELLITDQRPTTTKTRIIAQNQQIVRVDAEDASQLDTPHTQALLEMIATKGQGCDPIVLSDYGKGMVSPSFMQGLNSFVSSSDIQKRVLVDPKVGNFPLYSGVTLLTPNTSEAMLGAGVSTMAERMDIVRAGISIFKKLHCRQLLITLGGRGMAFFESPGRIWHIPTVAKNVYDVTGAGDTVIAVLALALAAGVSELMSCVLANHAAGLVVEEVGAATVSRQQLELILGSSELPEISLWLDEK